MAIPPLYVEITIPRFSGFWPDLVPATLGPDPDFDFLGGFPKVAKRFWPLRPPIGLRFGSFAITRRGLTDPLDGFGLKRPMARDRAPATWWIFGFWGMSKIQDFRRAQNPGFSRFSGGVPFEPASPGSKWAHIPLPLRPGTFRTLFVWWVGPWRPYVSKSDLGQIPDLGGGLPGPGPLYGVGCPYYTVWAAPIYTVGSTQT